MPIEVTLPKLGLTMTEGTISAWSVPSGSPVRIGDVIMLITTDKTETEIEAEHDGVLQHAVPEGTTLPPGEVVAWLLSDGEVAPDSSAVTPEPPTTRSSNGARLLASPNARRVAAERGIDLAGVTGTGPGGRITSEDLDAHRSIVPAELAAAVRRGPTGPVSPVARRLAERAGIDLAAIEGTGPRGRVTLDDVLAASPAAGAAPGIASSVPLRGMRGVIAERMVASLHEMAQLTLGFEVGMDAALALRAELKSQWGAAGAAVPGITDLVVKAAAKALVDHPRLNATIADGEIRHLDHVHVGLAVSLDDGLIVPVIRHADLLALDELALESARLASTARAGKLALADVEGSTFSITALGAEGVDLFTPVINPPNVAILGVGRIREGIAWDDAGAPQRRRVMTLSLTIDHRAVDGVPGARFLQAVAALLESPLRLLSS